MNVFPPIARFHFGAHYPWQSIAWALVVAFIFTGLLLASAGAGVATANTTGNEDLQGACRRDAGIVLTWLSVHGVDTRSAAQESERLKAIQACYGSFASLNWLAHRK